MPKQHHFMAQVPKMPPNLPLSTFQTCNRASSHEYVSCHASGKVSHYSLLSQRRRNLPDSSFDADPFVPSDPTLLAHRCEEIPSIQALGLKKRLAHTHAQTAVVGISGGLDSTLALLVTARAFDLLGLDRTHIIAITMPGFGTTDRTYSNACSMVKSLGATLKEIPIGNAVLQHFSDINHDPESHDVTYENSQARERTQILMDVANQENGLVIGTGDLSELALGWATYNGDHMSMYAVNSSVPKTLVRHLVRHYASHCDDKELSQILADVLDTPVSPELLLQATRELSLKKRKILWDPMSCMTSSCTNCFASDLPPVKYIAWHASPRRSLRRRNH